jgi:hypothetical protein
MMSERSSGDSDIRNSPVIVLAYPNSGVRRLQSLLEIQLELSCTSGTGVLAACHHAARAWRQVEGKSSDHLSALAIAAIRNMVIPMITMVTTRSGRRRWCEVATADRSTAETFLQVFPDAQFLCFHRECDDAISATLRSSRWGLSGAGFAPHVAEHPTSSVAALAAWWTTRTRPALEFERAHPTSCMRLRYGDLTANPDSTMAAVRSFLTLENTDTRSEFLAAPPPQPHAETADDMDRSELPLRQIPATVLAKVNQLQSELGYPRIGPSSYPPASS